VLLLGSFQLRSETVKAPEASLQDIFVTQAILRPTFQNLIDPQSFHAIEFVVSQISVVNYFGQLQYRSFTNTEEVDQRFESAAVQIAAEFGLYL
jgi:hypothetical protein